MKNIVIILGVTLLLTACHSQRKGVEKTYVIEFSEKEAIVKLARNNTSPDFINALSKAEGLQKDSTDKTLIECFVKICRNEYQISPASFFYYQNDMSDEEISRFLYYETTDMMHLSYLSILARFENLDYKVISDSLEESNPIYRFSINKLKRRTFTISNVDDEQIINQIIQTQGRVGFWETYSGYDYSEEIVETIKSNDVLKKWLNIKFVANGQSFNAQFASVLRANQSNVETEFNKMFSEGKFPENLKIMYGFSKNDTIPVYLIKTREGLEGAFFFLRDDGVSKADVQKINDEYQIYLNFRHAEEAKIWSRITENNINKQVATSIDNWIYCCPLVTAKISNGHFSIATHFTKDEAEILAAILRYPLSLKCNIVTENSTINKK